MIDSRLPLALANGVYTLTDRIGAGGMGAVYGATVDLERFDYVSLLAHASASRSVRRENAAGAFRLTRAIEFRAECERRGIPVPAQRVAIKVIAVDDDDGERFSDEWLSMIGQRHPNLVEVYGGGIDRKQGLQYYVMELVDDVLSLKEVTALPLQTRLRLGAHAAAGIAELHEQHLIHRDLKPSNVLCCRRAGRQPAVKVVDLGIAKDTDRSRVLTRSQQLLGTPNYLAPETIYDARDATEQTDVYGLGATLYEWFCGQAPYGKHGLYAVLARLVAGTPPEPARQIQPDLPRAIDLLLGEMLSHDPSDRPDGMEQVAERLDAAADALELGGPMALNLLPSAGPSVTRRALVVQEADSSRDALIALLEKSGLQVDACDSGGCALVQIGQRSFDVVLIDQDLPNLAGFEVMCVVREMGISVPAILFGHALAGAELREQAIGIGVAPLSAPIDERELERELERLLMPATMACDMRDAV